MKGDFYYEDIVAERNKLKLTVAEYEKSIADEQKNEESNKDVSTDNSVNKAGKIELPQCPIYSEDCSFTHYNITIDSFDADVVPVYGGLQVKIVYTVSGVTDDTAGAAYLKVFCYDKDGYSIDTSMVRLSNAVANEPFKIKGEMVVDAATAKIVFDKP